MITPEEITDPAGLRHADGSFYISDTVNPVVYVKVDDVFRPVATFWQQPNTLGVAETNAAAFVIAHYLLEALECAAAADALEATVGDERFTITERWLTRLDEICPREKGKHNSGLRLSQTFLTSFLPAELRRMALAKVEGGLA